MKKDPDNPEKDSKLASLDIFSVEQLNALTDCWIETPKQFVATAATEEGRYGLKTLLNMENLAFENTLSRIKEYLSAQEREDLKTPRKGGELGVRFEDSEE